MGPGPTFTPPERDRLRKSPASRPRSGPPPCARVMPFSPTLEMTYTNGFRLHLEPEPSGRQLILEGRVPA